jgi:hypothetical protein
VGNVVGGDLTVRDKIINTANSTTNRRTPNTGVWWWPQFVIVALVVGYFVIRGLIGALGAGCGLTGSSSCQDYLVAQHATLAR